jgi:hypothetical protein
MRFSAPLGALRFSDPPAETPDHPPVETPDHEILSTPHLLHPLHLAPGKRGVRGQKVPEAQLETIPNSVVGRP